MLSCENITCIRDNSVIFSQLGVCLQPESLLLLRGPNGSGKTSLLEILAGDLPAYRGQVLWEGKPATKNKYFKQEVMTIGHKSAMRPEKTVEENLRLRAEIHDTEMLIPAALKYYDLTPFRSKLAGHLSFGWQRRLALAQLIVAPCKLWLLDEPTDFLDEESVMLTVSLIETRVNQGGIVIAASHSLQSGLASHVLDMNDFKPDLGQI